MSFGWHTLLVISGLVVALEGLVYALAPHRLQALLLRAQALPPTELRVAALVGCILGMALIEAPLGGPQALQHLVIAIGVVLLFEGAMWVFAPGQMRQVAEMVAVIPPSLLSRIGAAAGTAGLAFAAVVHFTTRW